MIDSFDTRLSMCYLHTFYFQRPIAKGLQDAVSPSTQFPLMFCSVTRVAISEACEQKALTYAVVVLLFDSNPIFGIALGGDMKGLGNVHVKSKIKLLE